MIRLLSCRCNNSEPLLRKTLRENHHPKWASLTVVKGKEPCLNYLATLPENLETGSLIQYIKRSSSWSIILGEKDGEYRWVDVGHAHIKERLDAEIILEKFSED